MNSKISLLNIELNNITRNDLLLNFNKGVLYTPNVDHLVLLQKNKKLFNAYNNADWVICDSNIVQLGLKFLKTPVKEVIPGSSFFPSFYNYHSKNEDIKIFLLGAALGVAEKAAYNINKKVNRKIIVDYHSPSFGFEKNEHESLEVIKIINSSEANVLVVGLGAPKQELWIFNNKEYLKKIKIFMALGATLDFEAGNIKRAPKVFQFMHLEWFYRLLSEPKRLWKRYLIDDMPFFYYIIQQKFAFYKNPFIKNNNLE